MIMAPADAELALAAQAGSADAFGRLVDRHQQALRAFLRRVCARSADADDIAQETFLTAWTNLRRFRAGTNFKAWLFAIAWRKRLSLERSLARGARRDAEWQETRPQWDVSDRADAIAVRQALESLPLDQRAATALCLAGDFSHAEAADALGAPLGTIKSHVTRGRAKLMQALGVDDDAS
jgi:RNA polymerase sigma-70 factor (ECF subfamily)